MAGLIVASPGNPSGTMLSKAALADLISYAQARDIAFVSDEIYHGLHYGARAHSALEISDDVYVINSFSKYFSMTGWRVGWMVVPQDHLRTVERLAQNMFICAPHVAQIAALAALQAEPELEANRAVYAENRRLMLQGLPEAGFDKIAPPDGAFYIFPHVQEVIDKSHLKDDMELAEYILENALVASVPGSAFGLEGYIRFSYAAKAEVLKEAISRIAACVEELLSKE